MAVATKDMTSETVAKFILYNIGLVYGFPNKILSDRGTSFLSKAVSQLLEMATAKKINTSAYHPQTDGQAESSVKKHYKTSGKIGG